MATFVKIASVTVGSGGASSIDFTSIPSTYTDLCLKLSLRDNRAANADFILISFNGSTTSFTNKYIEGDGFNTPASGSTARAAGLANAATSTSNTFSNTEIYIPNYASSNYKSYSADAVSENNATTAFADFHAGLWSNTAAINQVTISPNSGTLFLEYSTATLYGIKNS
jgi:hypothetical protein